MTRSNGHRPRETLTHAAGGRTVWAHVARYEEFLAEDFTASLPDLVFRNRQEFLDLIAKPRPFKDLTLLGVQIRILGDVALLQGRVSYTTTHDNVPHEALYTDTYQRRDGRWLCVAGEVVAQGE